MYLPFGSLPLQIQLPNEPADNEKCIYNYPRSQQAAMYVDKMRYVAVSEESA